MKRLAIVLLIATAAYAQHPITFEDLAAIHRVGAPQISPDGKWIAYDVSTPDLPANTSHTAVLVIPSGGGDSNKIADGSGPVWFFFLNNTATTEKNQVYLYSNGAPRKLTDL